MNRSLFAACAAILLAGTLTACSSTPANTANPNGSHVNTGTGATNSGTVDTNTPGTTDNTGGTPSGTSYVTPRRTRYPSGADQDRTSYNRMTSNRSTANGGSDGRYTAYSDGYVAPGSNALNPYGRSGLAYDTARTARDMVTGVGDLFRDAGDAVRNVTGGINDTRQATAGETTTSQRMGNSTRNTMRNINAE